MSRTGLDQDVSTGTGQTGTRICKRGAQFQERCRPPGVHRDEGERTRADTEGRGTACRSGMRPALSMGMYANGSIAPARVCAWCGHRLGPVSRPAPPAHDTHTICPTCLDRYFGEELAAPDGGRGMPARRA